MRNKPGWKLLAVLSAVWIAAPAAALAQSPVPTPREKPAPRPFTQTLPAAEFENMRIALEAAEKGDWATVRTVETALSDPAAKKLVAWRIATSDERSGFREMTEALETLQGWPNTNAIQRDAEYALGDMPAGMIGNPEIVRWFTDHAPQTGEGKVAYAEALFALGLTDDGEAVLRDAWRENSLRLSTQRRLIAERRDVFTEADTLERIDFLAWDDQRNAVQQLLPLIPSKYRHLYETRLALAGRAGNVDAMIRGVASELQDDPGLLYERARWRRRVGNNDGAIEALRAIGENPESLTGRAELWGLRHLLAREALKQRDYQAAYDLSRDIGLDSGADFAEAEFMAGWVALRFLNQPEIAQAHFYRLANGVSTPVSLSRGWYWLGRAREAAGDAEGANAAYAEGAEHRTAFYGQLALAELDPEAALVIPEDPEISDEVRQQFEARDIVRALRMLGELDQPNTFATFAYHLENELEDPAELALLADLALDYDMPRPSLRVAKSARNRTLGVYHRAFPVAFNPPEGAEFVEPALALAISRQETEFEPAAVSSANARGLMQLIPATAQTQARRQGMDYRYSWLTDDPGYNAILGSSHLHDLIDNYNGSYIVSMAGYNAGPGNARRWIEEYGDPRTGDIDPIDWIELVSYSETRNYIQRVMENLQVYRSRLNGDSAPLRIQADLRRGELPRSAMQ